jgi:opacity protein-like surface antigen
MRIRTGLAALVVLAAVMPAAHAEGFSGFYSGITLGAHSQKSQWLTTDVRYRTGTLVNPGANPDDTSTIPDGTSLPAFLSYPSEDLKDTAYALGLVFGYNFEVAKNFILGVEIAGGTARTYDVTIDNIPGLGTTTFDPVTYGAVRTSKPLVAGLKFGYVVGSNTLAYVRANYERITVAAIASSTDCPASNLDFGPGTTPARTEPLPCDPAAVAARYDRADKLYTWGFGGGVEYMIGEALGVRLEYRQAKFGKSRRLRPLHETANNFGALARLDLKKSSMIELGVLFHF